MDESESYLDDEFKAIAAELWSHNATWWQDGFTEGADPEYTEQILPILADLAGSGTRILEIGTGEGQVLRYLEDRRERELMVGIDPTPEQIERAVARGGPQLYLRSGANNLPFSDAAFDTVIACLVFEHIDDLEAALREVSRVLVDGGRFHFLLNHPLFQTPDSGWIDDQVFEEQYWRIGRYLQERHTVEEVEKDVFIPFVHRPLSRYLNCARGASLRLETMLEPAPPQGFLDLAPEYYQARFVPRLLVLEFSREPRGKPDRQEERVGPRTP